MRPRNWYQDTRRLWIARAYDAASHEPGNPAVARAYKAFVHETGVMALAIPVPIEFTPVDPYPDAYEMVRRVKKERILRIYTESDLPAYHPLSGMPNLLFRAVHDWYGHIVTGNGFDAQGEENAFRAHSRMYSREALPALATETRGQNCWSNFGGHLPFRADSRAQYDKLPADRPFAPQKATLLPAWAWRF